MVGDELIDSRVSVKQCKRAVDAIHTHQAKKTDKESANELLPGKEQIVWLNVAVKKVAAERKIMPIRIPVVHPIVDPRTSSVCLITKDPQREYKDLLEAKDIKFISRVVGISKLKGKFKPFEARRILLKENGLFLADDRVIPLLPKLLGEKWFNAKKQPIPVTLTRKDLKKELEHAIQSTYMNQNRGTNTAIKIGTMSHTPAQILANLKVALPVIAKRISGGWDNVQALSIKTSSSASLPIWSCSLGDEEGGRWAGLGADADVEDDEDDDDESMKVDEPASKKPKSPSNGKKRAAADEEPEETSKPKKKTKGVEDKSAAEPSKAAKGKAPVSAGSSPKKEKAKTTISTAEKVTADSSKKSRAPAPKDSASSKETVAPPEPASSNGPSKKDKKGKKTKSADESAAQAPADSLNADDLKKKRSVAPGEKKKDKVVKAKGGKSAKNEIIGKKSVLA
ncbi:ribosomal protein L1p/L10e family-domain-containing protein [Desarmillaria tabescens]|uniref:Ribosomal L1 domain-containing protein 1 n=1 Tax=Armillaria tabescens TaxID=1929756 RepID=A0AA39KFC1_ARMTA|nr:ribosomal protein L1p/L10e family-domain-containing protein [Desarmillaria tabescens]KAK0459972.1 ribosomal protein L1p/L10e family-domain-containing protein [Desarmillaria tabescens]